MKREPENRERFLPRDYTFAEDPLDRAIKVTCHRWGFNFRLLETDPDVWYHMQL